MISPGPFYFLAWHSPCISSDRSPTDLSEEFKLNRADRSFAIIFVLALLVSGWANAEDPLNRCYFVFSSRRQAVLENLKKVNGIIQWNGFVTGRTLDEYHFVLSEPNHPDMDLKKFITKPRAKFHWWDSGGGQGVAIREGAELFRSKGQETFLVVNSLSRPLRSRFGWSKEVLYLEGVHSEDMSKRYLETFDLITDVFGPGGTYAVDAVGVLNSYLQALAVGGRLVMSSSFRSKVVRGDRVVSFSKWVQEKLQKNPDYRVQITGGHTVWIEKLRSTSFRLKDLDIDSYVSADELYRGYIDPEP